MRAPRYSLRKKLLQMASSGRPRPKSGTSLYDTLWRECKKNHAFRTKLQEMRPDWIPQVRDNLVPVKMTRNTGAKYRQTLEEMVLMGADRPKAISAEGRALYHLCRLDAEFKVWVQTNSSWDVRSRAERAVT